MLLFQVYRQHLIYLGHSLDAVVSLVAGLVSCFAYIGGKSVYSDYFEVNGLSEDREKQ